MKLTDIIKELEINQPIPKFRNNSELKHYLETNQQGRNQIVDLFIEEMKFKENWGEPGAVEAVARDWKNKKRKIEQHTDYNRNPNDLMIDDGEDNRMYLDIEDNYDIENEDGGSEGLKIKFGHNIIYISYY